MADRLRRHPWKVTSVGDETDSICPHCKEETIHRVVAMMEGKIHLVICTRCNRQHRYRPSLSAMRKKVALPTELQARVLTKIASAQVSRRQESQEEWLRLREVIGDAEPLPYDLSFSYEENQVVAHPTFGLGFVSRVIDAFKIEVIFEYETKVLAMNRPKPE